MVTSDWCIIFNRHGKFKLEFQTWVNCFSTYQEITSISMWKYNFSGYGNIISLGMGKPFCLDMGISCYVHKGP